MISKRLIKSFLSCTIPRQAALCDAAEKESGLLSRAPTRVFTRYSAIPERLLPKSMAVR